MCHLYSIAAIYFDYICSFLLPSHRLRERKLSRRSLRIVQCVRLSLLFFGCSRTYTGPSTISVDRLILSSQPFMGARWKTWTPASSTLKSAPKAYPRDRVPSRKDRSSSQLHAMTVSRTQSDFRPRNSWSHAFLMLDLLTSHRRC